MILKLIILAIINVLLIIFIIIGLYSSTAGRSPIQVNANEPDLRLSEPPELKPASSFSATVAQQTRDSCSSTEFWCQAVGCISSDLVCNGLKDCADGSDELGCDKLSIPQSKLPQAGCRKNDWTCLDGSCIALRFKCDGVTDCVDGSDEDDTNCHKNKIMVNLTSNDPVLHRSTQHTSTLCRKNEWTCLDGSCIALRFKCDGVIDCEDASDENDAYCHKSLKPQNGSCKLPEHPVHGTYITNIPDAKPGDTFDLVTINITCQKGFVADGPKSTFCHNGSWQHKMPKCVSQCHLPTHPSVEYQCLVYGEVEGTRTCKEYEPSGTEVSPRCQSPVYYSATTLPYMRCTNGKWDYVARCVPECGTMTSSGVPHVAGGVSAKHGEVPWHAGIYTKQKQPYSPICGGSIISTDIILSAAHCFWNNIAERKLPATIFAVAVGKLYSPWDEKMDDAQRSDVKELHLPTHYQDIKANFQADIAVVIVTTPFEYTISIRPVCIDFDSIFEERQLQQGKKGKVAGWGLVAKDGSSPSLVLKVIDLPSVNIEKCISESPETFRGHITFDKICGGFTDAGIAMCKGDSGGGLAFPESDKGTKRYYLRGIGSTAPPADNNDRCNVNTYTTFTRIQNHEHFIKQFWVAAGISSSDDNAPRRGNCILPPYPDNGSYTTNIPTAIPGNAYYYVTINVTCEHGYGLNGSHLIDCYNGSWSGQIPQCITQCHLEPHASVKYRCLDPGAIESRPCNEYEFMGTVVNPQCRSPHYFSTTPLAIMRCIAGNWDYIPICSECGTIVTEGRQLELDDNTQLARGKQPAKPGEVPWHAGIYSKTIISFNFICGATLISENTVLSNAACFWDDERDMQYPARLFAVAVGSLNRLWEESMDQAQKSDVKRIHLPYLFQGESRNFQDDIAVVIVTKPFKYNSFVRPVCLDFDINLDKKQLERGNKGKLAGWGLSSGPSLVLHVVDLPCIDIETCFFEIPEQFRQYYTSDKFCAGFNKHVSNTVCRGDSGGGLSFPESFKGTTRYYLRGILSTGPIDGKNSCVSDAYGGYGGYTHTLKHEHFIKQFWKIDGL